MRGDYANLTLVVDLTLSRLVGVCSPERWENVSPWRYIRPTYCPALHR